LFVPYTDCPKETPIYVPKVLSVPQWPKTIFSTNVESEVEYAEGKKKKKNPIERNIATW
jgi:hypothetical protein